MKCNFYFIQYDLEDGLVASYFVNRSDGVDETGNGANLTMNNATTYSNGPIGNGNYFTITNNVSGGGNRKTYVPYSSKSPYASYEGNIPALSVSVWVKKNPFIVDSTSGFDYDLIALLRDAYDFTTWNGGDQFGMVGSGQNWSVAIRVTNALYKKVTRTTTLDNQWNHISATMSLNDIHFYLNGVELEGTLANDGTITNDTFNALKNYILTFGTRLSLYSTLNANCGGLSISNVRFYARELKQQDVNILYNNGNGI